jgi:hypothetical protein
MAGLDPAIHEAIETVTSFTKGRPACAEQYATISTYRWMAGSSPAMTGSFLHPA